MSAIKDGRLPIVLDKERHLLFSLNVIDEMQDKFGGFDKLAEMLKGKDGIKNLRWLLTLLLNEGADDGEEQLTEKQVGKMIHTGNFNEVKTAIFKAFAMGNSGTTEPPQDDEDDAGGDAPMYDFHNAKAKREHWAAEREHAAFRKDAGELIEITTHIAAMADVGATVRAKLEAWASTLPPQLAGRDEAAVRATLVDQVELLLRDLADRMQRRANEGADSL